MGQHLQGGAVAGILFPLGGTQVLKGDPKHKEVSHIACFLTYFDRSS